MKRHENATKNSQFYLINTKICYNQLTVEFNQTKRVNINPADPEHIFELQYINYY